MTTSPHDEPPDHHSYELIISTEMRDLLVASLKAVELVVAQDLAELEQDPDLRAILGKPKVMTFAAGKLLGRLERQRDRLENAEAFADGEFLLRCTHGQIRMMKGAALFHLANLQDRRDRLASRERMSVDVLQAVDQQLAKLSAKVRTGVFAKATPLQLIASDAPQLTQTLPAELPALPNRQPRPVVLDSTGILDDELRTRCLDLLEQFRQDGALDRLDTVITEATRIFEHRIRTLSEAEATCVGVDLAKHAFAGPTPRIQLSSVAPEQEAAHLLFRGVFGFIRNQHHHRLSGPLVPERVLQIVTMIDYLLFLSESGIRGAQTAN